MRGGGQASLLPAGLSEPVGELGVGAEPAGAAVPGAGGETAVEAGAL
ncbi:MAG: hypothetical protein JWO60_2016, partial [Frankiales bacterium]|nr:hypothetical protein [Frankiales bacterium]